MKYEKGEEKNEFFNSFINRVILYDDKVIILYNSNDRETKRLSKKQLKDIENAKTLEDIKENSLESKKFKRVALGAGRGIRTPVGFHPNGFQDRLVMTASISLRIFKFCEFIEVNFFNNHVCKHFFVSIS